MREETTKSLDFRALFESGPGLYLVLAPDLTIVAVSEAYLRATMTKREEILGRGLFDVFPDNPDDPAADGTRNLRASLDRVRKNRVADAMAVQKYDIRRPESEGGGFEERFWSPVNSPLLDPGGELAYIIHCVEDVTEFVRLKQLDAEQQKLTAELRTQSERMEAEVYLRAQEIAEANRQLRVSEGRLQAILDNTTSVVYMKDVEGRYTFVNRRFESIFHLSRDQVIGKTNAEIFSPAVLSSMHVRERRVVDGTDTAEMEEVIPQDDGLHTYISAKFPLRDSAGNVYAVCSLSTDITERKRAEEEIERFFNLSLDMLCIAGFDGYFKRLNPAWEKALGFAQTQLLEKPFIEFVHPDDRAATIAEAEKLSQGFETISFTNRYASADGSYRWLFWNASPDRELQRIYAAARDVTEKRLSEEEIEKLNSELQKRVGQLGVLNQELEAFSYSVSHDLRAPLRHIIGFAELLEKRASSSLDEKGLRYLRTISEAAKQMGRLVDDLLLFSRMGRAEMRQEPVDLKTLAEEVRLEVERQASGRGVRWKLDGLPQVRGDRAMLRQVFVNLLSNALKYSGTRARSEVQIGSHVEGKEDVIFVRDNGVGFDMKYAEKLFGVFQRLHRAEEFEGTGIGLANVRRIIHRHGGRTWAEGAVGAGATFYFSLPRLEEVPG